MQSEWEIKSRSHRCTRTQKPFEPGETIYSLLFRERSGFRREDVCEAAWESIRAETPPFSSWRSTYESPQTSAKPVEPLSKASVEELLRQLMADDRPEQLNARYVLAVMLERRKTLKQVDAKEEGPERLLIYEHAKTGEVFLIADPRLRLDQIEQVQTEVMALLGAAPQEQQPEQ
jgi:hypothetical protein